MALTVNTNVASLTSQRNLARLTRTAAARRSSVCRPACALIVRKDDAAGLAISERFTSQIKRFEPGRS